MNQPEMQSIPEATERALEVLRGVQGYLPQADGTWLSPSGDVVARVTDRMLVPTAIIEYQRRVAG